MHVNAAPPQHEHRVGPARRAGVAFATRVRDWGSMAAEAAIKVEAGGHAIARSADYVEDVVRAFMVAVVFWGVIGF